MLEKMPRYFGEQFSARYIEDVTSHMPIPIPKMNRTMYIKATDLVSSKISHIKKNITAQRTSKRLRPILSNSRAEITGPKKRPNSCNEPIHEHCSVFKGISLEASCSFFNVGANQPLPIPIVNSLKLTEKIIE